MINKGGRPTLYREEYHCREIVKLSTATDTRNPMTFTQIAAKWDVCIDTLQEWRRVHPLFSSATTHARAKHKAWFDAQVKAGFFDVSDREGSKRLNANAIKMYAYMCFGVTEKREANIEFPADYASASFERRAEILIELLSSNKISVAQYKTLDEVLTAQYQRSCGDKILAAEEALKEAESKENV